MNANSYISGWCPACGRRRGKDGRCVNCDPWWTSPLIQVGGPMVALSSVLLVGLVLAVATPKPDPAAHPSHPTLSPLVAPAPLSSTASASVGPLSPPSYQPAPALAPIPQLPPAFFAPPPDPDAVMMANLEQLRYHVSLASSQMRQYNATALRNEQRMQYPSRSIGVLPASASSL